jgi:hypothetical protein
MQATQRSTGSLEKATRLTTTSSRPTTSRQTPAAAAAALSMATPLHRWRGLLEFQDAADEGAYIDWACGAWQVCAAVSCPAP